VVLMPVKISAGSTGGVTDEYPTAGWQPYDGYGIYIDVPTYGHDTVPIYAASLTGSGYQWLTTGANCIYSPTSNSFRVYLRWSNPDPAYPTLDPAFAVSHNWRMSWIAVQPGAGTAP
jgi:hypothetical protein